MERNSRSLPGQLLFRSLSSSRASILIIAVWVLFMLAAMAVTLGYSVRQKLSLAARLEQRDRARYVSWANIEVAISKIKSQGAAVALSHTEGHVAGEAGEEKVGFIDNSCGIFDEQAKININRESDMQVLKRLFMILLGYGDIEAQELAAAIIDWRDKDSMLSIPLGSAEDSYYTNLPYPYECRDADFQSLAELLLVKGINQKVFEKIRSYVTIYGDGLVNVNSASREVLLALGLSEYVANNIVSFRDGKDRKPDTKDDNHFTSTGDIAGLLGSFCLLNEAQRREIENVAQSFLTVQPSYFMINSAVKFGQRQNTYRATAVVDSLAKIMYWEEF